METSMTYRCEACDKEFETQEQLRRHVQEVGLVG
jgi:DNA-directed RNA polymerase subunit RPC12/RpoP